jgi:hypothetical protein
MVDSTASDYISRVVSYLPENNIWWDERSRVAENVVRRHNNRPPHENPELENSRPLKYILAQPALRWAWYLLLSLGLLYVIFRARRRQRIIPVLEGNPNQTYAYVSTIGRMYFLQGDNYDLIEQQKKLFMAFVRDRYNLAAAKPDEPFKRKLSIVSGVDSGIIERIFLPNHSGADEDLIAYYQAISEFKKLCK